MYRYGTDRELSHGDKRVTRAMASPRPSSAAIRTSSSARASPNSPRLLPNAVSRAKNKAPTPNPLLARRLSSQADTNEWAWYKLQEAVAAISPARTEAQKEHAALNRLLKQEDRDGGPFSRKYDERDRYEDLRQATERCFAAVDSLLSAAATLESCVEAALVAHVSDDRNLRCELDEARAAGETCRLTLTSELRQAEGDRREALAEATALKAARMREIETAADHLTYSKRLEDLMVQNDAKFEEMLSAFAIVKSSLGLENAQLRDDVIRGSEELHSLAEEHDVLNDACRTLRLENELLRLELKRHVHVDMEVRLEQDPLKLTVKNAET